MRPTLGKRKRDSEATRERILESAKEVFSERGFDAAGIREIAAGADVNVALVNRYFGSKEKLFEQAVIPELKIQALLDIDLSVFAASVAAAHVNKGPKNGPDPMLTLLRSAGSPTVGATIRDAIHQQLVTPLADKVGGTEAAQRAAMILAILSGLDLFRRIIAVEPLSSQHDRELSQLLEKLIGGLVSNTPKP